jgi:hypothetical protein
MSDRTTYGIFISMHVPIQISNKFGPRLLHPAISFFESMCKSIKRQRALLRTVVVIIKERVEDMISQPNDIYIGDVQP